MSQDVRSDSGINSAPRKGQRGYHFRGKGYRMHLALEGDPEPVSDPETSSFALAWCTQTPNWEGWWEGSGPQALQSTAPDWVLGDSCHCLPEPPGRTGAVPESSLTENFTDLFPIYNGSLFWAGLSWLMDRVRADIPVRLLSLPLLGCEEGLAEILLQNVL